MKKKIDKGIDGGTYTQMNSEDLILFAIYRVSKAGETCTFERLVAECFDRFPKTFTFKRYPQWPDPLKLDRSLRKLREKGSIVGTMRDNFSLTNFGRHLALETEKSLEKGVLPYGKRRKKSNSRSSDDRLIYYVKYSQSYRRFVSDPSSFDLSETEFRNLLRCTLETPLRVLKQNLEYYKNVAISYNEKRVTDLLQFCEKRFIEGVRNG